MQLLGSKVLGHAIQTPRQGPSRDVDNNKDIWIPYRPEKKRKRYRPVYIISLILSFLVSIVVVTVAVTTLSTIDESIELIRANNGPVKKSLVKMGQQELITKQPETRAEMCARLKKFWGKPC